MRTAIRSNAMNTISYSYTDAQVESTVKYSIAIGIIIGSSITGLMMNFFS